MSLLEWIMERRNPGPIGSVDAGLPAESDSSAPVKAMRALVSTALAGGVVYLLVRNADSPMELGLGIGAFILYLTLGFLYRPRPDYSNVGLLGGFVDHPLRWSDDVNRMLAFLLVLLYPGRLIASGLRDGFVLFTMRRTMHL